MNRSILTLVLFVNTLFFIQILNAQQNDSISYYMNLHQYDKVLKFISQQQELTRDDLFAEAMCHKALGNTRKSGEVLYKLSVEYPEDVEVKMELISSYTRMSAWGQIDKVYDDLIVLDPDNVYFNIQKAIVENKQKNYKGAISRLDAVLEVDSLQSALKLMGENYERINKLDSAIYYYDRAWSKDSLDSYAVAALINTQMKKEEFKKALHLSRQYQTLDAKNSTVNFFEGYSLYALGGFEASSTALEQCYMLGDTSLLTTRFLGMSYYNLGDNECTYLYLSKACAMDTTNYDMLYNLAIACKDLGKYEEAETHFKTILDKSVPSNMQMYLYYRGLGETAEGLGFYLDAVRGFMKASTYIEWDRQMYLYYDIARIYEEKMYSDWDALVYYKKYQATLERYIKSLPHTPNVEASEIQENKDKLDALKLHIKELELVAVPPEE